MRAEIEAVLGSCPKSRKSVESGIRSWCRFSSEVLRLPKPFPPPLGGLLAWSKTFQSVAAVLGGCIAAIFCVLLQVRQDLRELFVLR